NDGRRAYVCARRRVSCRPQPISSFPRILSLELGRYTVFGEPTIERHGFEARRRSIDGPLRSSHGDEEPRFGPTYKEERYKGRGMTFHATLARVIAERSRDAEDEPHRRRKVSDEGSGP